MPPQPLSHPSGCPWGLTLFAPQIPIQESLIEFVDGGTSKLATEAFQGMWGTQVPHPPAP